MCTTHTRERQETSTVNRSRRQGASTQAKTGAGGAERGGGVAIGLLRFLRALKPRENYRWELTVGTKSHDGRKPKPSIPM